MTSAVRLSLTTPSPSEQQNRRPHRHPGSRQVGGARVQRNNQVALSDGPKSTGDEHKNSLAM